VTGGRCLSDTVDREGSARQPPTPAFPFELTPGVLAMGHNPRSSFGAQSYLVVRKGGNLLGDSPRYLRPFAERVDDLGGIAHVLLSHRDSVADADRRAERYGTRVWIHAADAMAAPYATDVVDDAAAVEVTFGASMREAGRRAGDPERRSPLPTTALEGTGPALQGARRAPLRHSRSTRETSCWRHHLLFCPTHWSY
jgi:hypothetical protein